MVFFDLPTEGIEAKRSYTKFRNALLDDGFTMFQFSIYIRHALSLERAQVHIKRLKKHLPPHGHVGVFHITDKQFGMIELFIGRQPTDAPEPGDQLLMF